jgi:hypothetical protein
VNSYDNYQGKGNKEECIKIKSVKEVSKFLKDGKVLLQFAVASEYLNQ